MIELFLLFSVVLNGLLIFYATRLARRMLIVGSNIDSVYEMISVFRMHVEQIHEAEMFYGDQTLQALIDHSKGILDSLDEYGDLMALVEIETEEEGDAEKEED